MNTLLKFEGVVYQAKCIQWGQKEYELLVNGANDGLISFFIKDGCFMDYSGNYNIRSNSISLHKGFIYGSIPHP